MITKIEYNILKNIDTHYKYCYLVRNIDGSLSLFYEIPNKDIVHWETGDIKDKVDFVISRDLFKCIKWSDNKAKKIVDYIGEYEKYYQIVKLREYDERD